MQKGLALQELEHFLCSVINEEGFKNEKLSYFESKTHLSDPFSINWRDQ